MSYRLVLKKLRRSKPALLETVSHETAAIMVENLFPAEGSEELSISTNRRRERRQARLPNEEECKVTVSEMERVFWRRPAGNFAPGPDGIPAKILRKIPAELLESIRELYSHCLREGYFPRAWKTARLVMIPKGEPNKDGIPKARPTCLLNNIDKNFERIIMNRLRDAMHDNVFAALSTRQFGFCEGRSTVDALR